MHIASNDSKRKPIKFKVNENVTFSPLCIHLPLPPISPIIVWLVTSAGLIALHGVGEGVSINRMNRPKKLNENSH